MSHDYSGFEEKPVPTDLLSQISALAAEQKSAELQVALAEDALATAKATLRDIAERRLPELMDAAEMAEFTTRDGIKVSVKEVIRASLPKGREMAAFEWLHTHEHEGLIKNEFKIPLGSGDMELAERLRAALQDLQVEFEQKRTIHPATLASFVREQLEAGVAIPLDVFGAARIKSSKITFKD